jgi:hypothetical protein
MDSIFREKRINRSEHEFFSRPNYNKLSFRTVTHDNGVPRGREYSLSCKLYFTQFSGYTIKELIETNFNYFTWLPRNIENFTYDDKVLKYARSCLELLERIDNYPVNHTQTKLGMAIHQVDAMIDYELKLDCDKNKYIIEYYKMRVNVEYYKKIIDTPIERLIRQARGIFQISSEYRRKYFEEIIKD